MLPFKNYQAGHTEWTIYFLKFVETIMALVCMIHHLRAIISLEQTPHNMLFCATFGGYFILGLSTVLVPFSGQLTPPGVDVMFCGVAFLLFYSSSVVVMYYIEHDEYLNTEGVSDWDEENYPYFKSSKSQCILTIATGTLYLMHAVIQTDRLYGQRKGIREIDRDTTQDTFIEGAPVVDIPPNTTITLHLFFLEWFLALWNLECCVNCRSRFTCGSFAATFPSVSRKKHKRKGHPHKKAYLRRVDDDELIDDTRNQPRLKKTPNRNAPSSFSQPGTSKNPNNYRYFSQLPASFRVNAPTLISGDDASTALSAGDKTYEKIDEIIIIDEIGNKVTYPAADEKTTNV